LALIEGVSDFRFAYPSLYVPIAQLTSVERLARAIQDARKTSDWSAVLKKYFPAN